MKKIINVIFSAVLFFSVSMSAFANSGPSSWRGSNATGMAAIDENCPLEVKKEVLNFEINQFPRDHYSDRTAEELEKYNDRFTANYTFYNPKDYDVTATLAFPLGALPEYVDIQTDFSDSEKYNVTVNGTAVEKEIKFTRMKNIYDFDFSEELPKLVEGYMEDDFYHPDMAVTKYVIEPQVEFSPEMKNVDISFIWNSEKHSETKIIPVNFSGYGTKDGKTIEISGRMREKEKFILYVIGQPLDEMPHFEFYNDKEKIDCEVEITSSRMTFSQLIIEHTANLNIYDSMTETEIYNITLTYLKQSEDFYNMKGILDLNWWWPAFNDGNIMAWFLYDITVPAGQTVENSVTALLWPGIELNYSPYKYEYTYLLSPAQGWAGFDEIEININTPYQILEINKEGFMKTETGYSYKGDGLPEGELVFTVSESENPVKEKTGYTGFFALIFGLPFLLVIGLVIFFAVLIRNVERKNEEKQRKERNKQ